MFQFFDFNLSLFQFRTGRLVFLTPATAVFQTGLAELYVTQSPSPYLLVADLVFLGHFAIVFI